eukprot:Opistho-1_new@53689
MTTQAQWTAASGASACDVRFADNKTHVQADLDPEVGGTGLPTPHELLDAALAACTTLTLQLYIKRKGWALDGIQVAVSHAKSGAGYQMTRTIEVTGTLDAEQQAALLRIADACPVHKTLVGEIAIVTALAGAQTSSN